MESGGAHGRGRRVKIGVNGWRIHGQRTGVGRYLLNIVRHWTPEILAARGIDEVNFYTPKPIDRTQIPLPAHFRIRVLQSNLPMLAWENLRLAPATHDDAVFHPSFTRPLFARGASVVTVHEANLAIFTQSFPLSARVFYLRLYRWCARHATLALVHNEAGKADVIRQYGVAPARMRAIALAADEVFHPGYPADQIEAARQRYVGGAYPFFLFVGKLSGRRNVPRLIQAFGEFLRETGLQYKLLIIGLNSGELDISALTVAAKADGNVFHHPHISDADLCLLYNGAEAFIMPSSFETVSLPVMEAQASAVPVITVDTPGLRETTAGHALLLRHTEATDIRDGMIKIVREPELRKRLATQGFAHSQSYSWQRTSMETLTALIDAASLRQMSGQSHRDSE